jgi:hypothetical protein
VSGPFEMPAPPRPKRLNRLALVAVLVLLGVAITAVFLTLAPPRRARVAAEAAEGVAPPRPGFLEREPGGAAPSPVRPRVPPAEDARYWQEALRRAQERLAAGPGAADGSPAAAPPPGLDGAAGLGGAPAFGGAPGLDGAADRGGEGAGGAARPGGAGVGGGRTSPPDATAREAAYRRALLAPVWPAHAGEPGAAVAAGGWGVGGAAGYAAGARPGGAAGMAAAGVVGAGMAAAGEPGSGIYTLPPFAVSLSGAGNPTLTAGGWSAGPAPAGGAAALGGFGGAAPPGAGAVAGVSGGGDAAFSGGVAPGPGPGATPEPARGHQELLRGAEALGPAELAVRWDRAAAGLTVPAGTVIPAALVTAVDSDVAGPVVAQVTRDVFDRDQRQVVIPRGSRLIGAYDSRVALGESRLLVAWGRVIFPDGSGLSLPGLPAATRAGEAGLPGAVDNHLARVFGSAILLSIVSAGAQLSQPQESALFGAAASTRQVAAAAVGQELSTVAVEMLRRQLSVPPTVRIAAGTSFYVLLRADLRVAERKE